MTGSCTDATELERELRRLQTQLQDLADLVQEEREVGPYVCHEHAMQSFAAINLQLICTCIVDSMSCLAAHIVATIPLAAAA
jgi:hypothetical protein